VASPKQRNFGAQTEQRELAGNWRKEVGGKNINI
jgi:hypothetical protein